ncbi:MAG TPA: hypothetical protein DD491_10445, partial [Halieaceae bacterium]|nr:hypothetical protein [Halieaceae bacterium]
MTRPSISCAPGWRAEARRRLAPLLVAPLLVTLAAGALAAPLPEGEERAALRTFLERTINESDSFQDRYAAEVWLVDMAARLSPFVHDPARRLSLLRQVHAAATQSGLG